MSEERTSTDPGQDPFVWWNGALSASSEVRISRSTTACSSGDGIFETVRVYAGQPFAWRRHLERLEHSAAGLGLGLPAREEFGGTMAEAVLQANDLLEARLRITVTGGLSPLGSERPGAAHPHRRASEVVPGADATTVAISPWPRNEHGATAGLKTTSYAENVRALTYARELGAEAILENTQHQLCEATGSNVFVVSEGIVRTPPPSSGCLLGVTRAGVLELGPQLGLHVEETPLPLLDAC